MTQSSRGIHGAVTGRGYGLRDLPEGAPPMTEIDPIRFVLSILLPRPRARPGR